MPANNVTAIAPAGGITSSQGVIIGALFGVAAFDAAEGQEVELATEGAFTLPKATGAIGWGAKIYWDSSNGNATSTASGNKLIGAAIGDAASGDPTVLVRLNGVTI